MAVVGGRGRAVDVAGANPLNWVRVTPELAVSPLNWLSNEDSSASMSVGFCTLGICVVIFWRSAQLVDSFCCSVRSDGQLGLQRGLLASAAASAATADWRASSSGAR